MIKYIRKLRLEGIFKSKTKSNLCPYYRKAALINRLKGTAGYCELQNKAIFYRHRVGHIPYNYCEGIKGCTRYSCGVFTHFGKSQSGR
ncbi:MAG: hypothetical protein N2645_18435 [Clostridia bacterium]|nr:hypothetical protein [Clostridia bacterium]